MISIVLPQQNRKGGHKPLTAAWLFDILLKCDTVAQIDEAKAKYSKMMDKKDIEYLESVPDDEQYPAARCAKTELCSMYGRTASSTVESMNKANERMRDRSCVDVGNAVLLLLKMECDRFERMKHAAWSSTHHLTPRGEKLLNQVMEKYDETKIEYMVTVTPVETDCNYECILRAKDGSRESINMSIWMDTSYGQYHGTCECGVIKKDCVPCQHFLAVVRSKKIPELRAINVMPYTWTTGRWRRQFPNDVSPYLTIDMEYVKKNYEANEEIRYLPDFVGKNKRGRPKKNKRIVSALEKALKGDNKTKGKGNTRKRKKWDEDDDSVELMYNKDNTGD